MISVPHSFENRNNSPVLVTGIGMITALGLNRPQTWQSLLAGNSAIALNSQYQLPLAQIARLVPEQIARVEFWLHQATGEAIADAGLELPLPHCGLVIGSSRGYQAELEQILSKKLPLSQFERHWPGGLSRAIASYIKTQAPVLAPMAACATGNWAIAQAYELIQLAKCEMVLVGASDAVLTPLGIAGFKQMGALATTGLYPFSQEREGLVLGEGAAALLLESESSWRSRHCPRVYGQVLGFGITNDADHFTNPSLAGAAQAVRLCLQAAQLEPEQIDLISTHGTGTKLNDQNEANLIAQIFSTSSPRAIATKGATGHLLGATALLEAAFCLCSLAEQQIPPGVGVKTLAFPIALTKGLIGPAQPIHNALNFSFGFGGQNAIVALGRYVPG
ncbi:MAG: beta-ketoacyl synthase N-terminal-like domain-containing protein [Pseudanabaenaceae cyanobacterium bins.68]|nr:beta-ketoacyl synthase N-terminal-like domain-containing protein [Pseudanabaenaceae cyanobacterium bins.68]